MRLQLLGLSRDAELAARRGDIAEALRGFIDAGDRAAAVQLWRSAVRYYRSALELDLVRREPVARLLRIASRAGNHGEWNEYSRALDEHTGWPHFSCRSAQILTQDRGSVVACAGCGAVLEFAMTQPDVIEARPDGRFVSMPLAMAMLVLRRALWSAPREMTNKPARVRLVFDGHDPVWLDELGDWVAA
jgi:hypothetical protein